MKKAENKVGILGLYFRFAGMQTKEGIGIDKELSVRRKLLVFFALRQRDAAVLGVSLQR